MTGDLNHIARQNLFNDAFLGMKSQGFRKCGDDFGCNYRGLDGLKCVIGHCIPDDKYSVNLENSTPEDAVVFNVLKELYPNIDSTFAYELQCCHDFSDSPVEMETALRSFALDNDIKVPE